MAGAVNFKECPAGRTASGRLRACPCGRCVICGEAKHTAVHGPVIDQPPGSKPWGHEFKPRANLVSVEGA